MGDARCINSSVFLHDTKAAVGAGTYTSQHDLNRSRRLIKRLIFERIDHHEDDLVVAVYPTRHTGRPAPPATRIPRLQVRRGEPMPRNAHARRVNPQYSATGMASPIHEMASQMPSPSNADSNPIVLSKAMTAGQAKISPMVRCRVRADVMATAPAARGQRLHVRAR